MALIPKSDEDYLREKGFDFEIKQEGNEVHVVLRNWKLSSVYTPTTADVLIRLLPNYPSTQLDMFWTIPDVKLASTGSWPTAAAEHETYGGRSWQRWSRHTPEWRPGIDSLRTFITAISAEINRGI